VGFFAVPAIVFLLYVSLLLFCESRWRFPIAIMLIVPVFIGLTLARMYIPLSVKNALIEFTMFWTMVAQFAGVLVGGACILGWLMVREYKGTAQL
jgi:hypothetical protein